MTIFVLTQKEGSKTAPVGTASSERLANRWAGMTAGNDWYSFELDQLDHLQFDSNGPEYDPAPVVDFQMPVKPRVDEEDPLGSLRELSKYLHSLTDSMEAVQQAVLR